MMSDQELKEMQQMALAANAEISPKQRKNRYLAGFGGLTIVACGLAEAVNHIVQSNSDPVISAVQSFAANSMGVIGASILAVAACTAVRHRLEQKANVRYIQSIGAPNN